MCLLLYRVAQNSFQYLEPCKRGPPEWQTNKGTILTDMQTEPPVVVAPHNDQRRKNCTVTYGV